MSPASSNPLFRRKLRSLTVENVDYISHRHSAGIENAKQCLAKFLALIGMHADSRSILLGEGRSQIVTIRLIVEHSQPFFGIQFQELEFRVPRGLGGLW